MRAVLSEKNLVIVLFVLVLVAFSFAHEDSKKMEQIYAAPGQVLNTSNSALTQNQSQLPDSKKKIVSAIDPSE